MWSHASTNACPLLQSTVGRATFQAFLKSEFSDENIEFWLICEDYKKIKSTSQLISRAKKIFFINIDYKTRELIKQNVKAPNHAIRTPNPRFLRSDFYRTLLESVSNVIKV
uniref:Regulator of G protein signaling 13a n=1 Tax=Electrophorus electricus TaxID=8005 RepID=A0AAY5F5X3_ELEEL